MNSAEARRLAKHAARQLLEAREDLAGELAVHHAAVVNAHAGLTKAQEAVADAEVTYRQVRADTIAAGWSSDELTRLGCPPSRLRLRQPEPTSPDPTASGHEASLESPDRDGQEPT